MLEVNKKNTVIIYDETIFESHGLSDSTYKNKKYSEFTKLKIYTSGYNSKGYKGL